MFAKFGDAWVVLGDISMWRPIIDFENETEILLKNGETVSVGVADTEVEKTMEDYYKALAAKEQAMNPMSMMGMLGGMEQNIGH